MALVKEDKNLSKQSFRIGSLLVFAMAFVAFVWAVFDGWTYFNSSVSHPVIIKNKKNTDETKLSGKDGAYFVSLPLQQIQLVESISPIRTLEVQIAFAVQFTADKNQIDAKLPQIQDTLISYLRTASLNELQETSRLFYIKEALLERMNNLLFPTQIQDVLFQKIVVKEGI